MVEWCTPNLLRDDSSFTWHQPRNNQIGVSVRHFGAIKNTRYKRIQSLIQNHMRQRYERSESVREQRTALYQRINKNSKQPVRNALLTWRPSSVGFELIIVVVVVVVVVLVVLVWWWWWVCVCVCVCVCVRERGR